jgi:excisionase family DNA binding protein
MLNSRTKSPVLKFEPDDRLLKVSETCTLLGLSRATVYRLITDNAIPIVRIGGTIRFRYRALLLWMQEHETPARAA